MSIYTIWKERAPYAIRQTCNPSDWSCWVLLGSPHSIPADRICARHIWLCNRRDGYWNTGTNGMSGLTCPFWTLVYRLGESVLWIWKLNTIVRPDNQTKDHSGYPYTANISWPIQTMDWNCNSPWLQPVWNSKFNGLMGLSCSAAGPLGSCCFNIYFLKKFSNCYY